MTEPPVSAPRNGFAIATLVLGIVSFVGALLIGIRFSGLNAIFYGLLPILLGGVTFIIGIVGVTVGVRRRVRGIVASTIGMGLGSLAWIALFVGRWLGEDYLGFPYPG